MHELGGRPGGWALTSEVGRYAVLVSCTFLLHLKERHFHKGKSLTDL